MDSLARALAVIDGLHSEDPEGQELAYAERMTHWLHQLAEDPAPALVIATRAQHLKRWERPRGDYPAGRKGYLQWRQKAAEHHADLVCGILRDAGFDEQVVARVETLVRKRGLGKDKEVQTLEDCACLVFLETELVDFRARHPQSKVEDILQKTWRKMSPRAQELAGSLSP